jgi:hypothetical protein
LAAYTRRTGATRSRVIGTALGEWLRTERHPQIRFVEPAPGERRASVAGGPEVWSVAEAWLQHPEGERTVDQVALTLGLRPGQVEAALAYWADNREEIDSLVARIHAAQDEAFAAWERRREIDRLP